MANKLNKTGFVIKLTSETRQKLTEEQPVPIIDKIPPLTDVPDKTVREKVEHSVVDEIDIPERKKSLSPGVVELNNTVIEHPKTAPKDSSDVKVDSDHSWGSYAPYITYEGDLAIYTDPSTQQKYTWNETSNSWVPKPEARDAPGRTYTYEDDTHVYTEPDGSKFFWDNDKKAWIPKVDDDFLAYYQMSYGFVDNTSKQVEQEKPTKVEKEKKADQVGVKRKNEPQWFDPSSETNTKVYVSNLPLDLTEEEFVDFMQKCGLVERDPSTQKMKVKLYMDKEQKCFKGDALCTYIKIESIDLALKLLDGSDFKGNKIRVERAQFELKGEYNPALKPKKKKKKELDKLKKMQQKLFDWRPEKFIGERSKHERVVIVKNLFHPSDFDKDVQLILDYQQDLREECTKCGEVRKVVIYDGHPEGVAQITMKDPEQADAVILLINGRWFGKRQITAEIWDGRTKYRIAETDANINKRINKWDKFLEGKEEETEQDKVAPNNDVKQGENLNLEVSSNLEESAKLEDTSNIDKSEGIDSSSVDIKGSL